MTDGEWWYDKDGKRYGPYSVADMERHLISKEISIDTMLWCEGMKGWTRMAAVAALQDLLTDTPRSRDGNDRTPTVDVSGRDPFSFIPAPAVLDNPAGRWSRFLARQIDLCVFGAVAWFVLDAIVPSSLYGMILTWIISESPMALMIVTTLQVLVESVLITSMALLLEAPVMAITGGTIGKWIFGITVRRLDGRKLSMAELFRRNRVLWGHGLGSGIPVVNLYFWMISYNRAGEGKRSRWDEIPMHTVQQKPIGFLRWAVGLSLFIYLVFGSVLFNNGIAR